MLRMGCILLIVLMAGCDRDPYMSRKGGYTPGTFHERYNAIIHSAQPRPGVSPSSADRPSRT
jgi:hypothetical protein